MILKNKFVSTLLFLSPSLTFLPSSIENPPNLEEIERRNSTGSTETLYKLQNNSKNQESLLEDYAKTYEGAIDLSYVLLKNYIFKLTFEYNSQFASSLKATIKENMSPKETLTHFLSVLESNFDNAGDDKLKNVKDKLEAEFKTRYKPFSVKEIVCKDGQKVEGSEGQTKEYSLLDALGVGVAADKAIAILTSITSTKSTDCDSSKPSYKDPSDTTRTIYLTEHQSQESKPLKKEDIKKLPLQILMSLYEQTSSEKKQTEQNKHSTPAKILDHYSDILSLRMNILKAEKATLKSKQENSSNDHVFKSLEEKLEKTNEEFNDYKNKVKELIKDHKDQKDLFKYSQENGNLGRFLITNLVKSKVKVFELSSQSFKLTELKDQLERELLMKYILKKFRTLSPYAFSATPFKFLETNNSTQNLQNLFKSIYKNSVSEDNWFSKESEEILTESLTLEYLSKDNFDLFRKHLKNRVVNEGISTFLFLRKKTDDKGMSIDSGSILGLDAESIDAKKWDPLNEDHLKEIYSLLSISASNKSTYRVGFKGLVRLEDFKDAPSEVIADIHPTITHWNTKQDLIDYAKSISSDKDFDDFISKLKNEFPTFNWSIFTSQHQLPPTRIWSWTSSSRTIKPITKSLTLEEKKKIFEGFITLEDKNLWNSLMSYSFTRGLLKTLPSQSKTKAKKTQFQFKEGGEDKIVEDKEGNKYEFYAVPLRLSDLDSKESWKKFYEKHKDLVARTIVDSLSDKSLQKSAIYYFLNEETTDKLQKYEISNEELKSLIDFQFQSPSWI